MAVKWLQRTVGQFIRDLLSSDSNLAESMVDSKGRISIPAYVRRNYGLSEGSKVGLRFNLKRNMILIIFRNGQDGVEDGMTARTIDDSRQALCSTKACGAFSPGAKDIGRLGSIYPSLQSDNPGPGPLSKKGGKL